MQPMLPRPTVPALIGGRAQRSLPVPEEALQDGDIVVIRGNALRFGAEEEGR